MGAGRFFRPYLHQKKTTDMPSLPEQSTLQALQRYQHDLCEERGWTQSSDLEIFLLFSEEVGELAKAIRNKKGLYIEKGKERPQAQAELEKEMADVLCYLLELANVLGVDLDGAFRRKEAANALRQWGGKQG
jgi:NTP pyrophosphatase (non-canonical NTP hydrolase)